MVFGKTGFVDLCGWVAWQKILYEKNPPFWYIEKCFEQALVPTNVFSSLQLDELSWATSFFKSFYWLNFFSPYVFFSS